MLQQKRRKNMRQFQYNIFYDYQALISNSTLHKKYHLLFKSLDLSALPDTNDRVGCTGYSRHAIMRSFIIKALEEIPSVPRLIEFLEAHPILTEMCGFSIGKLPDETQFYRFLSSTKTSVIESIHHSLNKELIEKDIISLSHFLIDSKPIMAATRNNNFKNPKRNTRNKNKKPRRNPNATLSYYSYQEVNGKKNQYIFFWGYRTHVICSKEGIALVSVTLPNSETDAKVARRLIKKLKRVYRFKKGAIFIADAAYDERDFYTFIANEMRSHAFIPINPRNQQEPKTFGPHGCPLCEAGLEMKSAGSWTEGNRDRLKFRCPLKADTSIARKYPNGCPANKPCFTEGAQYGCTAYQDITDDARARVPRDSLLYKETYPIRTEVERYFSRLGQRETEQTTHYKLKTVKNQMTIAHLSLSLVAHAAALLMQQPEKIRSCRTFAKEYNVSVAA
jgi:hypothetical protein